MFITEVSNSRRNFPSTRNIDSDAPTHAQRSRPQTRGAPSREDFSSGIKIFPCYLNIHHPSDATGAPGVSSGSSKYLKRDVGYSNWHSLQANRNPVPRRRSDDTSMERPARAHKFKFTIFHGVGDKLLNFAGEKKRSPLLAVSRGSPRSRHKFYRRLNKRAIAWPGIAGPSSFRRLFTLPPPSPPVYATLCISIHVLAGMYGLGGPRYMYTRYVCMYIHRRVTTIR